MDDWKKIYEKKTHTKFEPDARAKLFFDGEKGFAEIGITKNLVVIGQLCGDVRFWRKKAEDMARQLGINHLGSWLSRNVKAYMKFFGAEIEEIEDAGAGFERYHCRLKDTGKPALFSPRSINSAGNIVYIVTWEI